MTAAEAKAYDPEAAYRITVAGICQHRGWSQRLRCPTRHGDRAYYGHTATTKTLAFDASLDGGSYAHALRAAGIPERGACIE